MDSLRAEILRHPQIKIEDTPQFYDMEVFNRCAQTQNVMVTLECWKDVHPALVTIPVDWDFPISYGLLYALEPSQDVLDFLPICARIRPAAGEVKFFKAFRCEMGRNRLFKSCSRNRPLKQRRGKRFAFRFFLFVLGKAPVGFSYRYIIKNMQSRKTAYCCFWSGQGKALGSGQALL